MNDDVILIHRVNQLGDEDLAAHYVIGKESEVFGLGGSISRLHGRIETLIVDVENIGFSPGFPDGHLDGFDHQTIVAAIHNDQRSLARLYPVARVQTRPSRRSPHHCPSNIEYVFHSLDIPQLRIARFRILEVPLGRKRSNPHPHKTKYG